MEASAKWINECVGINVSVCATLIRSNVTFSTRVVECRGDGCYFEAHVVDQQSRRRSFDHGRAGHALWFVCVGCNCDECIDVLFGVVV